MNKIYIITTKRGGGESEIYTIRDTYEGVILAYYELIQSRNFGLDFMLDNYYMFEFPINEWFCETLDTWCNIKFGKSCKYRLKFKTKDDFMKIYNEIKRSKKMKSILKYE